MLPSSEQNKFLKSQQFLKIVYKKLAQDKYKGSVTTPLFLCQIER